MSSQTDTEQLTDEPTAITRDMTIQEILSLFPSKAQKLKQIITNAGLHCIGCHAATYETLEAGMAGHGFGEAETEALLEQLNGLLKEQEESIYDMETITLTARAAEKFLLFCQAENKVGWSLRFGDRLQGCSGFVYDLDFSEAPTEHDRVFHSQGLEIHVHKECCDRLLGSVIDYIDGMHSQGFKIDNPNANTACGCGSSHNYAGNTAPTGGCCSH